MLIPLSALDAFRRDVAANPEAATSADARWLQIVSLLQQAGDIPRQARGAVLDAAAELTGPDALAPDGTELPFPITITADIPKVVEAGLRSAIAMEDAARFQLAYAAYDALLKLTPALEPRPAARGAIQGTICSLQGRVARSLGDADLAREHYRAAEEIGREHRNAAVLARAWVGYGAIAHVRGNVPEMRRWSMQVLAESGAARESRQVAHHALMLAAVGAGDFETATRHGWEAYELTATPDDAAAALSDLSQLMRDSGRPRLALRGFSAALLREPRAPRHQLSALGGAALAAAESVPPGAARPLIDGYARRIERLIEESRLPWSHASALADLGDAYAILGDRLAAEAARGRAEALAESHHFFELLYRVTEGATPVRTGDVAIPAPDPLPAAQDVLDAVGSFEVPADVERALAAAGAL